MILIIFLKVAFLVFCLRYVDKNNVSGKGRKRSSQGTDMGLLWCAMISSKSCRLSQTEKKRLPDFMIWYFKK